MTPQPEPEGLTLMDGSIGVVGVLAGALSREGLGGVSGFLPCARTLVVIPRVKARAVDIPTGQGSFGQFMCILYVCTSLRRTSSCGDGFVSQKARTPVPEVVR